MLRQFQIAVVPAIDRTVTNRSLIYSAVGRVVRALNIVKHTEVTILDDAEIRLLNNDDIICKICNPKYPRFPDIYKGSRLYLHPQRGAWHFGMRSFTANLLLTDSRYTFLIAQAWHGIGMCVYSMMDCTDLRMSSSYRISNSLMLCSLQYALFKSSVTSLCSSPK